MNFSTIALPDLLDAMQKNVELIIRAAGLHPYRVRAIADTRSKTASCSFRRSGDTVTAEVSFPVLPATTRLSKAEADRWTGYFIHEAAHAIYTDEATWKDACREGLQALVNGLEDVRIERELVAAGIADNAQDILTALVAYCVAKLPKKYDPNDVAQLPWTFAFFGRVYCNGYAIPDARRWARKLTPQNRATIFRALDELKLATSTGDVLEIARKLTAGAKQNPAPAPAPNVDEAPGKSDAGDEGDEREDDELDEGESAGSEKGPGDDWLDDEEDEGESDAGDEGESDAGDEGEGELESEENDDEGLDGEGEIGTPGDNGSGSLNPGDYTGPLATFDPAKMKETDLDPLSEATKKKNADVRASKDGTLERDFLELIRSANGVERRGVARIAPYHADHVLEDGLTVALDGARRCSTLRAQAARVLKALDDAQWQRQQSRGRLDRAALSSIGAGNVENVFARRFETDGYETEITVLVDGSGSMAGERSRVAATLALAIAQAADQVAVPCRVVQFHDALADVKRPGERCMSPGARRGFGALVKCQYGSTQLTDAIVVMGRDLAARGRNKRKILFVITDGACNRGPAYVRRAAHYVESLNVETIGLSIDCDEHGAFSKEVKVSSTGDVAGVGFGALLAVLEAGALRHVA